MEKVFIIRWYGLLQRQEVRNCEKSLKSAFNFYMIGGNVYPKRKTYYYIGKAERKLLSDRLNDRNDHINDFSKIGEIWIGTIVNKRATHKDVMLVEKMLTSYFAAEGNLLNAINKKLPEESVYLINEWIHHKRNSECLRLPRTSIGNMMPDVIIYKKNNYSDEYKLFISNKLKITE